MSTKIIVLLADGTGNSAAKLFKTNVWRLYNALDLSDPSPAGQARQIAYYHDGVGTSRFKPLTILGGVFGVGLKRNVIDIYAFLCRNYSPHDRIYAYGFSRGAFTIRALVGLVMSEGVLCCGTEEELKCYATDAYRHYRRHYKLPIFGYKDKTQAMRPDETVGLVDLLRKLRDSILRAWRRLRSIPQYEEIKNNSHPAPKIEFVGVWDTVAAYGLPIDEMTRGIDEWVWPLSMPNYELHPNVSRARHALSLDDERNTFHPLLWDEIAEERLINEEKVARDRLQQVWFAGVHSNVGGGYADDSLSYVALDWMIRESAKSISGQPGLRFRPSSDRQELQLPPPDDFGRLYDSRSGVAAYYRYQPRRIAAVLEEPHPNTLLLQDPNRGGKGFLKRVRIHGSVFHRIQAGNDRYAPLVLPEKYEVVGVDGTVTDMSRCPSPSAGSLEWVWNDVWRRRVNYFMTLGATALLALFPLIQFKWPPSACTGPQCLLTPVIETVGAVLPGFAQPWIEAFAVSPGWFLLVAVIIFLLLLRSHALKRSVHDGIRELWEKSLGLALKTQPPGCPTQLQQSATPADGRSAFPSTGWDGWIYRLRTALWYQRLFQFLKWRGTPALFGATVLFGGTLLILALILVGVQRGQLAYAEWSNRFCGAASTQASGALPALFDTRSRCWPAHVHADKGVRYRVTMWVIQDWVDRTISTNPIGFTADRLSWYVRPSVLLRRSLSGRWFQPMIKIIPSSGRGGHVQLLEMSCACERGSSTHVSPSGQQARAVYTGEFEAGANGDVFMYVNDVAAAPITGLTSKYYDNNEGRAKVRIEPYPVD